MLEGNVLQFALICLLQAPKHLIMTMLISKSCLAHNMISLPSIFSFFFLGILNQNKWYQPPYSSFYQESKTRICGEPGAIDSIPWPHSYTHSLVNGQWAVVCSSRLKQQHQLTMPAKAEHSKGGWRANMRKHTWLGGRKRAREINQLFYLKITRHKVYHGSILSETIAIEGCHILHIFTNP